MDNDFVSSNAEHFNRTAAQFDNMPQAVELAQRCAIAMRKAYDFDESSTTVMDFACGTGLLSRELAPFVKSIVGVDISKAMVELYNERVEQQGISADEMRAVCTHLKGTEGELNGMTFDAIVCSSSYHHFPSIIDITRTLAHFLKPGGTLLVVDLTKKDNMDLDVLFPNHFDHIVAHRGGFNEADIRNAFDMAGLDSFTFGKAMDAKKHGQAVEHFIAKGTKRK